MPAEKKQEVPAEEEQAPAAGASDPPEEDAPSSTPQPKDVRCKLCGSSWSEEEGCANLECEENPTFAARVAAEAARAKIDETVVAKARECALCNALVKRPCSPEHYRAAGYDVIDARFLELFGEPLRVTAEHLKKTQRHGRVRVRILERIGIDGHYHLPGDKVSIDAKYVDMHPACFEELREQK